MRGALRTLFEHLAFSTQPPKGHSERSEAIRNLVPDTNQTDYFVANDMPDQIAMSLRSSQVYHGGQPRHSV